LQSNTETQTPAFEIAFAQSQNTNMSLSMGALNALNHSLHPYREKALSRFYQKWQKNSLVMEKWLMLSSVSAQHGTIDRLEALMKDPVFDPSNPNKIRSVLGAFASANPVQFHKEDGSGYDFIAQHLLELDTRNPQIAARMGLCLTRFAHYGPERRKKMQKALHMLADHTLSRDLSEVIEKALKV